MTRDEMDKAHAYAKTFETDDVKVGSRITCNFSADEESEGCWVRAHIFVPREAYEEMVSGKRQAVLNFGRGV